MITFDVLMRVHTIQILSYLGAEDAARVVAAVVEGGPQIGRYVVAGRHMVIL